MDERDWQGDLQPFLDTRFGGLCYALGLPVPSSGVRIVPPLAADEAKYFLLGIEAGLFELDRAGYVRSGLFDMRDEASETQPELCQIFWDDPLPPRLFREAITQLSTTSALVLQRGWLRSQVAMAPSIEQDNRDTPAVDILVKSTTGRLLACAEIKRTVAELDKLKHDFAQCCRRGKHSESECGFPQNHDNFEFCAAHRPLYFWAVAPGSDLCFRLNYPSDSTIQLYELPSLPQRSLIEREIAAL